MALTLMLACFEQMVGLDDLLMSLPTNIILLIYRNKSTYITFIYLRFFFEGGREKEAVAYEMVILEVLCFYRTFLIKVLDIKKNYDLDLEAMRRACFFSYPPSCREFAGGMTILYIVPAFHLWSLMHCCWSHPMAAICCRKFWLLRSG